MSEEKAASEIADDYLKCCKGYAAPSCFE